MAKANRRTQSVHMQPERRAATLDKRNQVFLDPDDDTAHRIMVHGRVHSARFTSYGAALAGLLTEQRRAERRLLAATASLPSPNPSSDHASR